MDRMPDYGQKWQLVLNATVLVLNKPPCDGQLMYSVPTGTNSMQLSRTQHFSVDVGATFPWRFSPLFTF